MKEKGGGKMKKKVLSVVVLLLLMGYAANASAVTIGTWADYNMSKVKYKNRVLLSNNAADFDFRSEDSHDVNGDGIIDFLEAETFAPTITLPLFLISPGVASSFRIYFNRFSGFLPRSLAI